MNLMDVNREFSTQDTCLCNWRGGNHPAKDFLEFGSVYLGGFLGMPMIDESSILFGSC